MSNTGLFFFFLSVVNVACAEDNVGMDKLVACLRQADLFKFLLTLQQQSEKATKRLT